MTTHALVRESLLDAAAILLPVRCAGCGAPDLTLCSECGAALRPVLRVDAVGDVPVWSALAYDGVARRVLLAYKDSGRVDLARALARVLREAIAEAQRQSRRGSDGSALLPVVIPSTRAAWRGRGYHPTRSVLARAHILVPPLWGALRLTRQTVDQAGLSAADRSGNRAGSMRASSRLTGRDCLIVDDILTSGATIAEAARAIRRVGGRVTGAVTIARTPLRNEGDAQRASSGRTANGSRWAVSLPERAHYGSRKGASDPPLVNGADIAPDQGGLHGHQHHRTQPGYH
ncbi:phosphoribosyltransferase family protein [Leifsonia xyli]|uniref:ComF family protein n=1 Tax=Leifsonia xyli TaxID=1575 RepID=UPI0009ED9720